MADVTLEAYARRIADLEQEVAALRDQLALYQFPDETTFSPAVLALDEEAIATYKAFVGFDATTVHHLTALQAWMAQEVDGIVEAFYTHLRRFAPLRTMLADPAVLQRLCAAQTAYLLSLTHGDYGQGYFRQRWRIGEVHNRLNLTPQWYLGSYSVFFDLIVERLQQASPPDTLCSPATLQALVKAFSIDMQLAIEAYITSYQIQLRQANTALQQYSQVLEARVAERTEELLQAGKLAAIGELAAGIAHEINNPINGIMNYADIIAEELPAADKLGGLCP